MCNVLFMPGLGRGKGRAYVYACAVRMEKMAKKRKCILRCAKRSNGEPRSLQYSLGSSR